MKKIHIRNKLGSLYITFGVIFCLIAVILLAYPQLPYLFNALKLNTPEIEKETIVQPVYEEEIVEEVVEETKKELPPIDPELPTGNYISIPKVGINAQIQEGEDSSEALRNGPWIVSDYATPESRFLEQTTKSIIIASHRFGYSSWSEEKRNLISFFKLPDTKVGDRINIVWNQRDYLYEIVEEDKGEYIKEYDTDLILYTCNYYNTPIRIFRYADLVSINGSVVN